MSFFMVSGWMNVSLLVIKSVSELFTEPFEKTGAMQLFNLFGRSLPRALKGLFTFVSVRSSKVFAEANRVSKRV